MRFELITAPGVEPVTLSEAKDHARVTVTDDDALITSQIVSARNFVEAYTKRFCINQTWEVSWDLDDNPDEKRFLAPGRGRIESVTSITSYDSDDVGTVFDAANYRISGDRIVLKDNAEWPALQRCFDTLVVRLLFGFGATVGDVPDDIKQAIMMLVSHWYDNREASGDPMFGKDKKAQIPFGVTPILEKYRIFQV